MLDSKYLTVRETARFLKIGINKTYQLVKTPDFPALRIGNTWLVDREQLERIWLPNKQQTTLR